MALKGGLDSDQEMESLLKMREKMLDSKPQISAAICIGGKQGVVVEYELVSAEISGLADLPAQASGRSCRKPPPAKYRLEARSRAKRVRSVPGGVSAHHCRHRSARNVTYCTNNLARFRRATRFCSRVFRIESVLASPNEFEFFGEQFDPAHKLPRVRTQYQGVRIPLVKGRQPTCQWRDMGGVHQRVVNATLRQQWGQL